jgi:hypothetical protein
MSYYAKNPHYSPVDLTEEAERLERAEEMANRWFADATKKPKAAFDAEMARIAPYKGSVSWAVDCIAAHDAWQKATAGAELIRDMVIHDMMLSGEVSTSTAEAFDDLTIGATP